MKRIKDLFLYLALTSGISLVSGFNSSNYITFPGEFNKERTLSVNSSFPHVHIFTLESSLINGTINVRVDTTVFKRPSLREEIHCPVIFFLKETRTSRSWALPLIHSNGTENSLTVESYTEAGGFTVCLEPDWTEANIEFMIFVSTCSAADVTYSLNFTKEYTGFLLGLDDRASIEVAPTLFHYFRFNFPEHVDRVVVEVSSDDKSCTTVSVQSPWCKVLNENTLSARDENGTYVKIQGLWQDMTTRAAIPVMKSKFDKGFFIGFVVHDTDERCGSYNGLDSNSWAPIQIASSTKMTSIYRKKLLKVRVLEELHTTSTTWPIILPFVYMVGLIVIISTVYCLFQTAPFLSCYSKKYKTSYIDNRVFHPLMDNGSAITTEINLNDDLGQDVFLTQREKEGITNGWLRMNAFINKPNKRAAWAKHTILTLIIGIFYSLPTIQLAYTYEALTSSTGQTDVCYRNYLCSHSMAGWDDFNHLYSNIAYVIFGLVFLLFVWHRHYVHERMGQEKKITESSEEGESGHGVIGQGDIFYSLGVALMLEGVLSGLYHNCPTQMNFQYDTSFMFILAVLSTVTIFQFRHKDPVSPYNIFALIALIAFISVGGLKLSSKLYEAIVMIVHLGLVAVLSVYLYYVGYTRDEDGKAITNYTLLVKCGVTTLVKSDPLVIFRIRAFKHKVRLGYLLPFVIFNLIICVWQISGQSSFPMYLVYAFGGNMGLYFGYYCGMKVYHREIFNLPSIQPLIYLGLSLMLGPFGVYYFLDAKYNTDVSPAESKTLNGHCIIAGFYDSHDIWHFLSAGAIFSFFMGLLTLDDGILQKPRKEIVAF